MKKKYEDFIKYLIKESDNRRDEQLEYKSLETFLIYIKLEFIWIYSFYVSYSDGWVTRLIQMVYGIVIIFEHVRKYSSK